MCRLVVIALALVVGFVNLVTLISWVVICCLCFGLVICDLSYCSFSCWVGCDVICGCLLVRCSVLGLVFVACGCWCYVWWFIVVILSGGFVVGGVGGLGSWLRGYYGCLWVAY